MRSTRVTSTSAPARAFAAERPPNPPPTTTTRGRLACRAVSVAPAVMRGSSPDGPGFKRDERGWRMAERGFSRLRSADRLLGVAAKLLAHRREHLIGEVVEVARAEAREQRARKDRRGYALLDRGDRGPAPLARVRDAAREILQIG